MSCYNLQLKIKMSNILGFSFIGHNLTLGCWFNSIKCFNNLNFFSKFNEFTLKNKRHKIWKLNKLWIDLNIFWFVIGLPNIEFAKLCECEIVCKTASVSVKVCTKMHSNVYKILLETCRNFEVVTNIAKLDYKNLGECFRWDSWVNLCYAHNKLQHARTHFLELKNFSLKIRF
jgi:hypothetical protein